MIAKALTYWLSSLGTVAVRALFVLLALAFVGTTLDANLGTLGQIELSETLDAEPSGEDVEEEIESDDYWHQPFQIAAVSLGTSQYSNAPNMGTLPPFPDRFTPPPELS